MVDASGRCKLQRFGARARSIYSERERRSSASADHTGSDVNSLGANASNILKKAKLGKCPGVFTFLHRFSSLSKLLFIDGRSLSAAAAAAPFLRLAALTCDSFAMKQYQCPLFPYYSTNHWQTGRFAHHYDSDVSRRKGTQQKKCVLCFFFVGFFFSRQRIISNFLAAAY